MILTAYPLALQIRRWIKPTILNGIFYDHALSKPLPTMNSPFALIFLALQQRISSQVPTIRHIDQELGQLKSPRPPVAWPCVLTDFEDFVFENLSRNVQTARGTVVLRLAVAPHGPTAHITPSPHLENAIDYLELEWQLNKAIHAWAPGTSFGRLMRTSVTTQKGTGPYRVRELRYAIAYEDYSAMEQPGYAPAAINVNSEILL